MEDNKYFYESEYKSLSSTTAALRRQLEEKNEELRKQELLLEELYKLVYYKRAWLTLSDENIEGMQKVVGKLPQDEESAYPNIMPKTSAEYDDNDPWGV